MIEKSTYQAAKAIAEAVETHFSNHITEARQLGELELAPTPHAAAIELIIDTAFWASLQREEGFSPKISLAFLPPEQSGQPLIFEYPLSLSPYALTKLAPAVERSGIHLGVWHKEGELYIWGTTRIIPSFCFVLEVVEPGLLVIKHRRIGGFGKFVNIAVLHGGQVKLVDEHSANIPDHPALIDSLLGLSSPSSKNECINVLVQLAASMRAHGKGGSLLVVPGENNSWAESIIHPISYPIVPPYSALSELMTQNIEERNSLQWQGALTRAVESVAGLTAVDGATIITDKNEVLAFGAKIGRSSKSVPVEQIIVTEPVLGNVPMVVHPAQNGGTRHLSAAQFVFDQRDALALVASQDGRFTIFAWSQEESVVHAYRVDALLL
jgi:hypothetical protein